MSLLKHLVVPSGDSTEISGLSDSEDNSHGDQGKGDNQSIANKQQDEGSLSIHPARVTKKRRPARGDKMYQAVEERSSDISKDGSINSIEDSELSIITKGSKSRRRRRLLKSKLQHPEHSIDPLELKYLELNDILLRDYVERKKPERQVSEQSLGRLCEQYISIHGRPPPVPGLARALTPSSNRPVTHPLFVKVNAHLQHTGKDIHSENTQDERHEKHGINMVRFQRPTSATMDRASRQRSRGDGRANSTGLRRSRSAGSNRLVRRKARSNASVQSESISCGKPDSSIASSPRTLKEPVDCHLNATHNDDIQTWLKRKNQLLKEENKKRREKKRQERLEQMEQTVAFHERSVLSQKEARKWIVKKKHEAWLKQKEEKITRDLVKRDLSPPQRHINSCLKPIGSDGNGVEKPRRSVNFSFEDPNSSLTKKQKDDENNITVTTNSNRESMKTSFMYKRAPSGKIRFKMPTINKSEKRCMSGEKDKRDRKGKTRVSYDQWLLIKRNEEMQKRQFEKQAEDIPLSQSVTGNAVLVEAGKRKVREVLEKKTTLDTGEPSIRRDMENPGDKHGEYYPTIQTRPKPSTRSPSRGQPRLKQAMESKSGTNPFILPFPPELGVPRHVAAKQKQIFSSKVLKSVDAQSGENGKTEVVEADNVTELLNGFTGSISGTVSSSCPESIEDGTENKDDASPRYGFNKTSPAATSSSDNEDRTANKNSKPSDADGLPGESFFLTSVDQD